LQRGALLIGLGGSLVCLVFFVLNPDQAIQSYLFAYLFFLGLDLGCLSILMLSHLTGGMWGLLARRIFEAAIGTLPILAVGFLPIALFLPRLYVWARPLPQDEVLAAVLKHKAPYLNGPFFLARAVFYFAVWIGLTRVLTRWSAETDSGGNAGRRLRAVSGGGLVLMGLTITFSSFDWGMSLDPRWFSAIYGILFMVGQALSAFAFVLVLLAVLRDEEPFVKVARPSFVHDIGKLLFAFVMLWTYMHLSQFLIIWSGNLPEEDVFYVKRLRGGFQFLGLALVLFHFALPFLLLLSRGLKENARLVGRVAAGLLVMHLLEAYWLVVPEFRTALSPQIMDVAAPLALGGLWFYFFAQNFKGRPKIPVGEPEIRTLLEAASA
jgi:hypothetical protein